jgi:hypothetical protein
MTLAQDKFFPQEPVLCLDTKIPATGGFCGRLAKNYLCSLQAVS